jgi:hypothetical protein
LTGFAARLADIQLMPLKTEHDPDTTRKDHPIVEIWNKTFQILREANPLRISEELFKCIGFIGESTQVGLPITEADDLLATGFFVAVPVSSCELPGRFWTYFVTARHVAKDLESRKIVFVVNKKGGGVALFNAIHGNKWYLHPTDDTADVAIVPVSINDESDIRTIPIQNFATIETLKELNIGVGDDIYTAGLFTPISSTTRIMPIVRSGNIAMMPGEQIQTELGYADVYLVEARSIGGLSGSPVFVQPTIKLGLPSTHPHAKQLLAPGSGWLLLGLMHGHWDVKESEINEPSVTHDRKRGVNYGIAIVVPAYKISETINQPGLIELRRSLEEIELKRQKPSTDSTLTD